MTDLQLVQHIIEGDEGVIQKVFFQDYRDSLEKIIDKYHISGDLDPIIDTFVKYLRINKWNTLKKFKFTTSFHDFIKKKATDFYEKRYNNYKDDSLIIEGIIEGDETVIQEVFFQDYRDSLEQIIGKCHINGDLDSIIGTFVEYLTIKECNSLKEFYFKDPFSSFIKTEATYFYEKCYRFYIADSLTVEKIIEGDEDVIIDLFFRDYRDTLELIISECSIECKDSDDLIGAFVKYLRKSECYTLKEFQFTESFDSFIWINATKFYKECYTHYLEDGPIVEKIIAEDEETIIDTFYKKDSSIHKQAKEYQFTLEDKTAITEDDLIQDLLQNLSSNNYKALKAFKYESSLDTYLKNLLKNIFLKVIEYRKNKEEDEEANDRKICRLIDIETDAKFDLDKISQDPEVNLWTEREAFTWVINDLYDIIDKMFQYDESKEIAKLYVEGYRINGERYKSKEIAEMLGIDVTDVAITSINVIIMRFRERVVKDARLKKNLKISGIEGTLNRN